MTSGRRPVPTTKPQTREVQGCPWLDGRVAGGSRPGALSVGPGRGHPLAAQLSPPTRHHHPSDQVLRNIRESESGQDT